MAKSSSFSIVPDSLINVGTAFGILLGLAVGLMSGMMITTETPTTTTTTTTATRSTVQDTTVARVRTLLVQRASLMADSMRLQANGQAADPVLQLLRSNSAQLLTAMNTLSSHTSAQVFANALDEEAQLAANLAVQVATENAPNISAAQTSLAANTDNLQRALLAVSSGAAKDLQPVLIQHTNAVKNLALTVKKTQTYQAESAVATTFDALATYLQNYRR